MTCGCPHCAEALAIQRAREAEREARDWVDPTPDQIDPPEHEREAIVADIRDEIEAELQKRATVNTRADGGKTIYPANEAAVARAVADRYPVAAVEEHPVPTNPPCHVPLGANPSPSRPVVCVRVHDEYDVLIWSGVPGATEIRRVD